MESLYLQLLLLAPAAYLVATLVGSLIARAGFPLPEGHRRIGHIDGLRGYLALSVLVHHFIIWTGVTRLGRPWAPPVENILNQLGPGSVALFFMTTGFVFYPRVLSGWRANSWVSIYIGRMFRILPLVTVSVTIIAVIIYLREGVSPRLEDAKAMLLWISSWSLPPLLGDPDAARFGGNVLWSLWFEWFFYLLILPACAIAVDLVRGRLPTWTVPMALLLATLAARAVTLPRNLPVYLPLFAVGMLAFEVSRNQAIATLLRGRAASLVSAGVLAAAVIGTHDPYGLPPLAAFGFFFACVACGNDMGGMLATRGALVLGECSYGLYLLHGIVLALLFVQNERLVTSLPLASVPLLLPVVAALTVTLTAGTYLLIERPGIGAGRRLASWWTGRRRPSVSAPELEIAP